MIKRLVFLILLLSAIPVHAGQKFNSDTGKKDFTGLDSIGIDCSAETAEGRICWDSDDDKLYMGTGAAVVEIAAGASGDITAVGDCTSGACFAGASGSILTFQNATADQTLNYSDTTKDFELSDDLTITDGTPHVQWKDSTVGDNDYEIYADADHLYFVDIDSSPNPIIDVSSDKIAIDGLLDMKGQNIRYVECDDSISTAITDADIGDVLVLGACTYTITSAIAVNKALTITGQGIAKTVITSTTATHDMFNVTSDSVTIRDMSITHVASGGSFYGIRFNATGGTVFTNSRVINVKLTAGSAANQQRGIGFYDACGEVRNVIISSTSTNNSATGIETLSAATQEAGCTLNMYNLDIDTSSGSGTSSALLLQETMSAPGYAQTVNLYNVSGRSIEGGASTSRALNLSGSGTDLIVKCEDSFFGATDTDINASGTITLNGCSTSQAITNGTLTYDGIIYTEGLKLGGKFAYTQQTIAADDTTPDVLGGSLFITSANTGATAITDLDNPIAGQIVCIVGGSATNSSTIADSGNFNLAVAYTAGVDDFICLYVQADNDYIELYRSDN